MSLRLQHVDTEPSRDTFICRPILHFVSSSLVATAVGSSKRTVGRERARQHTGVHDGTASEGSLRAAVGQAARSPDGTGGEKCIQGRTHPSSDARMSRNACSLSS